MGVREKVTATIAGAALLAGGAAFLTLEKSKEELPPIQLDSGEPLSYPAGGCTATDGDTVRCGEVRVRLVEIDAPELPGHCRRNRVCAPGNPFVSKDSIREKLDDDSILIIPYDKDRYGRIVGDVQVGGISLSCHQVKNGYAIKELKWGDFGVLKRMCNL